MLSAYNVTLDFARKMKDGFDRAESGKFVNSFAEKRNSNIATNIKVADSPMLF